MAIRLRLALVVALPLALLMTGCLAVQNETVFVQGGFTYTVGEVSNRSDAFYRFTEVVGTYYDSAGNIVASESSYTCTDLVNPHDSAPFMLMVMGAPQVARYELAVQGRVAQSVLPTYLSLASVNTREDDYSGLHVLGSVTNNGTVTYEYVQICAAFYRGGVVADTDFTYLKLDILNPGQSGSFDLWAMDLPSGVTSVRLWVDARQSDSMDPIVPITTGQISLPR